MRTCGDCGWPDEHAVCYADGHWHQHARDWPACAVWKPKADWRDETCGTCEFRGDEIVNYIDANLVIFLCHKTPANTERADKDAACAEWMPKEE